MDEIIVHEEGERMRLEEVQKSLPPPEGEGDEELFGIGPESGEDVRFGG